MVGIDNKLTAYCFDSAVWLFGTSLENDLEEATQACKDEKSMRRARMRVMDRWFPENRHAKGRFKDPVALT